jgi:transcriptional regulator with XRE-family HTH domain
MHSRGYASGVIAKEGKDKMKLRQVLAKRLRELMDKTPSLDTQVKVSAAAGVAQTTISRILKCQVAATLDNVESIADAFGIRIPELLTLHPVNSPVVSDDDRRTIQRLSVLLGTHSNEEAEAIKRAAGRAGNTKKMEKLIGRHKIPQPKRVLRRG